MSSKNLTRREFLRIVGMTSTGLIVAACAPQVAPTTAPSSSSSAAPAGTAAPQPTTGPKTGGILKIATFADATGLGNPPTMLTTYDLVMSKTCIESLGRFDPSGVMVPWLADNWKTDATAKTITVTLKKGIKFHDGTDFNAAACKWNIDHFVGAKRAELPGVTSVEAVDDSTVRITLANWDNTAIIGMAYFAGPQISPTAWQNGGTTDKARDDWATNNPVGTGPFQFVSRQKDVKQVYKKFAGFWQKGKPYLDGIEWDFIADPVTATASYKAKEVDVVWSLTPQVAHDLKTSGENIVELKTGMGLVMMGLVGNSALPDSPFANVKARQALSYALDTKAILDSQYYGYAVATQQWGVPNGYWANPNFKGYPYNPAMAKQLVTDAGFPNGIKTKLLVSNTPDNVAVATAIQNMLAKANIAADLDVADNARYRQLTSQTNFEGLCYLSFRADSDLALIMPRNLSASGTIAVKSLAHPDKIEQLLTQAKQAPDQDSKRAKVWELQTVVFEEYSIFSPMLVLSGLAAKQPYVHNDGMMTVEFTQWTPEDAWLDK